MADVPETPSLYERLCSFENLLFAYRRAARGKRSRPDVATFEYCLEDELLRLRDALRDKTYRPGSYRRYKIREPKQVRPFRRGLNRSPTHGKIASPPLFWLSAQNAGALVDPEIVYSSSETASSSSVASVTADSSCSAAGSS